MMTSSEPPDQVFLDRVLENIWDKYDCNKNGILNAKEFKKVLSELEKTLKSPDPQLGPFWKSTFANLRENVKRIRNFRMRISSYAFSCAQNLLRKQIILHVLKLD